MGRSFFSAAQNKSSDFTFRHPTSEMTPPKGKTLHTLLNTALEVLLLPASYRADEVLPVKHHFSSGQEVEAKLHAIPFLDASGLRRKTSSAGISSHVGQNHRLPLHGLFLSGQTDA